MLVVRFSEFHEYLLVPRDGQLCLPKCLPDRFKLRVKNHAANFTEVDSRHHGIMKLKRSDILQGNGIWIVSDDCKARGGYGEIPHKRQFMNISIDEDAANAIELHASNNSYVKPLSIYHGTSRTAEESIMRGSLHPSLKGMLGSGIYCGTFWKAVRFACMSQDYHHRDGIIIRLLCFPQATAKFPNKDWVCPCGNCLKAQKKSRVSDHDGLWKEFADSAHVSSCDEIKNEEWALSSKCKFKITHYSDVDSATLGGAHHDPLYRCQQIL